MACDVAQELENAHGQGCGDDECVRSEELDHGAVKSMQVWNGRLGEVRGPRGLLRKSSEKRDAKQGVQHELELGQAHRIREPRQNGLCRVV